MTRTRQPFLVVLFLLGGSAVGAEGLPQFESDQQADRWFREHSAFYLRMAKEVDRHGGYEFLPTTEYPGGLAYTKQGRGYIELNVGLKGAHRASIIIFELTNLYQEKRHQEVAQRVRTGELNSPIEFALLREMIEYDGLRLHREVLLELQPHLGTVPAEMITWASSNAKTFAAYLLPYAYDYIKAQRASGHTNHFLKLFEKHRAEYTATLQHKKDKAAPGEPAKE